MIEQLTSVMKPVSRYKLTILLITGNRLQDSEANLWASFDNLSTDVLEKESS